MLSDLFVTLLRVPTLKKVIWREWYQFLAKHYRRSDWTFMNYGFQDDHTAPLTLDEIDEKDRYCIQLYKRVVGAIDVAGLKLLEVGCGRGGGASFVARYLNPVHVTGVDLSMNAVSFCRKTHSDERLDFQPGDSEHLPFPDATFDAVFNVESSHCYPNLDAFFAEVRRVLKDRGHFLYADLHDRQTVASWRRQIEDSGLAVTEQSDITMNVLTALDRDNDRKEALLQRFVPSLFRRSFADFAGMRGSKIYEAFRSNSLAYCTFVARR